MRATIRSGANLIVKMAYDTGTTEKVVGFCTALTYQVNNGVKVNHVVDTPFPAEIAYGGAPMQVTGTMSLILPKGTTLENSGLVPYRTAGGASGKDGTGIALQSNASPSEVQNTVYIAGGKYCHLRVYDRESNEMIFGCDYMKVQNFQINMAAKQIVRADISFIGKFLVVGAG